MDGGGGHATTGSVRVTCFGGEWGEFRLVGHRRLIVRRSGSCGRRAAGRPRQWKPAAQTMTSRSASRAEKKKISA